MELSYEQQILVLEKAKLTADTPPYETYTVLEIDSVLKVVKDADSVIKQLVNLLIRLKNKLEPLDESKPNYATETELKIKEIIDNCYISTAKNVLHFEQLLKSKE